ncbi:hypothetical protein glysoja_035297 [Glycine soja]|uniref:Uncharacterized protein n=1 Tax=Glycine soja TaxID=3848 RepID=A0A0B2RIR5_GLYSO|nr:hypothetical protein glysoja_035297 [Glycine soja]
MGPNLRTISIHSVESPKPNLPCYYYHHPLLMDAIPVHVSPPTRIRRVKPDSFTHPNSAILVSITQIGDFTTLNYTISNFLFGTTTILAS